MIRRWPIRSPVALTLAGWIVLSGAWVALVELQARSPWLVLAAMAIVWIADTAAYFAGRAFGRRKLAPLVSPGKSWEGVFGGLVAALFIGSSPALNSPAAGVTGIVLTRADGDGRGDDVRAGQDFRAVDRGLNLDLQPLLLYHPLDQAPGYFERRGVDVHQADGPLGLDARGQ